ncbi:hypothetical protein, partial [Accumulibacter sp.]|uniref:hypothetical protein n=1 Tax=Accumulibacter sp. TaxID=2053492 RepID=UPI0025D8FEEB
RGCGNWHGIGRWADWTLTQTRLVGKLPTAAIAALRALPVGPAVADDLYACGDLQMQLRQCAHRSSGGDGHRGRPSWSVADIPSVQAAGWRARAFRSDRTDKHCTAASSHEQTSVDSVAQEMVVGGRLDGVRRWVVWARRSPERNDTGSSGA